MRDIVKRCNYTVFSPAFMRLFGDDMPLVHAVVNSCACFVGLVGIWDAFAIHSPVFRGRSTRGPFMRVKLYKPQGGMASAGWGMSKLQE